VNEIRELLLHVQQIEYFVVMELSSDEKGRFVIMALITE
jgi:hypothetical protein